MIYPLVAKLAGAVLLPAAVMTFAVNEPSGHVATSRPALVSDGQVLPDPCMWQFAPAPPQLRHPAALLSISPEEKGLTCPIERGQQDS